MGRRTAASRLLLPGAFAARHGAAQCRSSVSGRRPPPAVERSVGSARDVCRVRPEPRVLVGALLAGEAASSRATALLCDPLLQADFVDRGADERGAKAGGFG